ncbi:helix-turn-helix domain-containing protein [Erwinia sp. S43]|uniref:helix-turn-helix domain-containing protein n=1 Tax=Erwinia sp. S43 TaxID=2769339 RepID=UPI0019093324|nr:helix-turn-helix domain-containing protein [Erwinia sp. S43]MBK0032723.1 helix-turn-helix domain-containing protein [Erwinia sp. S43]
MSVKLSAFVWDGCAAAGMKITSVAIMARLADFSNDEGVCWPSVATIARQIGAGPSTVRTALGKLEQDGWISRTARRKGNRNGSNLYQINVKKLRDVAMFHLSESDTSNPDTSKSDASESDRSKSDASNFDPSENPSAAGFHPPESGGDPSVTSKHDPSDKKTVGRPAAPADKQQADSLKIDYQAVLAGYHETLPEMPKVIGLTDKRRTRLNGLWKKFDFTQERWMSYLRFIAKNCRWMLEDRPDSNTGKTWRKKNFDYLITEDCYIAVKEERANDLPKVAQVNHAERDEAFSRLVSQARKPQNAVEEFAKAAASKAGLGRMNEVMARSAWKSIWSESVQKASAKEMQRSA